MQVARSCWINIDDFPSDETCASSRRYVKSHTIEEALLLRRSKNFSSKAIFKFTIMCDELSARLFRPWSNLDTRDHSKQIEVPVGHDDSRDIVVACDGKEGKGCYNILMIRGKAIEASSSEVGVSSFNLPDNTGGSGSNKEKLTSKVIRPLNDHSLRTADRIRMPLVQDIVDPVFHPMYSWNSFRKFNLPHSTSFDAVMMDACLPTQMGIAYPPWMDVRKTQFLSALQPSYDVRGNLHAETTMDHAVEILQRQMKEPKKLRSKRFRCERCNVAFSNNGQLKGHIRIHTGKLLNIFIHPEIS